MKCREFRNDLSDWLSGRLAAGDAGRMGSHEAECAECAESAAGERELAAWLRSAPEPEPCRDLWPDVRSRLEMRVRKPAGILVRWVALAGATAAAAALVLALRPGAPNDPGGGQRRNTSRSHRK